MATDVVVLQCNACGGIYRRVQDDGTEYFHACPPARVTRDAVVDGATGKILTPAVVTPIVDPRDENIAAVAADGAVTIVSDGAGASPVLDVTVLTTLGIS